MPNLDRRAADALAEAMASVGLGEPGRSLPMVLTHLLVWRVADTAPERRILSKMASAEGLGAADLAAAVAAGRPGAPVLWPPAGKHSVLAGNLILRRESLALSAGSEAAEVPWLFRSALGSPARGAGACSDLQSKRPGPSWFFAWAGTGCWSCSWRGFRLLGPGAGLRNFPVG